MSFAGSPPTSPASTEPDDYPLHLHSYHHHQHHHHQREDDADEEDADDDDDEEEDEQMGAEFDGYDTEVDSPTSSSFPPHAHPAHAHARPDGGQGGEGEGEGEGGEDGGSEMAMDLDTVHGQLEKLELSDTDMDAHAADDSDSDSNFSADSSESEDLSSLSGGEGDDDDELGDVVIGDDYFGDTQPPLPSASGGGPGPGQAAAVPVAVVSLPPHFTSPQYEAWLAAQTPNVAFQIRIKPLIAGSMIAAHSIRLWYRDFASRAAFLARIVDEYQLMGADDICGFVVKERRSRVWVQFGTDEPCWHAVLGRIRHRLADENFPGNAVAVRAELKVLVGGGPLPLQGQIVDKGVFRPGGDDDDPDL